MMSTIMEKNACSFFLFFSSLTVRFDVKTGQKMHFGMLFFTTDKIPRQVSHTRLNFFANIVIRAFPTFNCCKFPG